MRSSRLLLLLLLLLPGTLHAERGVARWRSAFPPTALETHLPGSDLDVVVAASAQPGSAAAAEALQDVLVGCPSVRRAELSAHDGPADDAARIAWTTRRAAGRWVAFVRVERDADDRPSAVVSLLDSRGNTIGAFVASAEEPLRSHRGASPAEGLGRRVVSSVDAVLQGPSSAEAPSSGEQLPAPRVVIPRDRAGHLQIDDAYAQYPGTHGGHGYRERLEGEQLYQALDRPDLAEAYAGRRRARLGLIATGSVLVGLGLLCAGSATIAGGVSYTADYGDHSRDTLVGGGVALGVSVGIGTALILAGKLMPRHPVGARRLLHIADAQHRALEERGSSFGGSP